MGKVFTHIPKTIMEVYQGLPEGTLAELIDNQIYMSPSPVFKHQKTVQLLNQQLLSHFSTHANGEVIIAPFDVYLDETSNAVQPDITVILEENRQILDENGHIHGVPDLLVEVLSPGNRDHDLITKKDLYEQFGVKEYWAVDPETRLALGFTLKAGKYELFSDQIGKIESVLLGAPFSF